MATSPAGPGCPLRSPWSRSCPALFGLSWDESLHIDDGRDPGPLANPSHYLLLGGLFGIFTAGWIAVRDAAPRTSARAPPPSGSRPAGTRRSAASCSSPPPSFALLGFPLDDVSHRLFGQDVTLWGATHLMMLSGAVCAVLWIIVLLAEGRLARRADRRAPRATNGNGVVELLPLGRRLRPDSAARSTARWCASSGPCPRTGSG